ncbi:unnamed protein product [Ectocarpus sp. 12 AP-2014]
MKTYNNYLIALLTLIICSCSKDDNNTVSSDPQISNGLFDETFIHNGLQREYLLYIPESYTDGESFALVFSLHGAGCTKENQYELSQFNLLAENENFILGLYQLEILRFGSSKVTQIEQMM